LGATMAVAILAASCIKPRVLIASLLMAFISIAVLCIAVGQESVISTEGDKAFTGIFGSKNAFAGMMSLLLLVSTAVYLDKGQPFLFRIAALGGVLLTPVLIYLGKSLGAILAACFTIAIFLVVRFLTRFTPKTRLLVCTFIFMLAVAAVFFATFLDFDSGAVLQYMGKDTSLTGRTYLWQRAFEFAADHPILGVGYASFWRLDNPRAQELWFASHVPPGAGFGFHDEYIQMLVELGIVGVCLIVGYFYVLTRRVMKGVLGAMSVEQNFAFPLFIFYIIRTPVETALFSQFNIGIVLFSIIWIYFQPPDVPKRSYKIRRNEGNIFAPSNKRIGAS
jgi:exopolysaccharide production protein ExoQ